jgi:putative transposase
MVELATQQGRYGHRRAAAPLRAEGVSVNHERVGRLWRREGLKVPQRRPKRGRLRPGDGSRVRLRPGRKDHVRSYDSVRARTRDGRAFRMLNVIDESTRECLAIDVARRLKADDVLERLSDLFVRRGVPEHSWAAWARRPCSSSRGVLGKLSDELLDGEVFDTLLEAKVLIERYRVRYNTVRPHSSLGYQPPAPEAVVP